MKPSPKPQLKESRFATPSESPGFLLWQVSTIWQRQLRAELDRVGLTHPQFVLLAGIRWLGRHGAPVTQVELARNTKTDVMTTSQVLRSLETRGLVARKIHPHDTRAKCVDLTPESQELLGRAFAVVEEADLRFFSTLGAGLNAFKRAMRKLIDSSE